MFNPKDVKLNSEVEVLTCSFNSRFKVAETVATVVHTSKMKSK